MWIPKDAQKIEAAARRGDLRETATFDAKADLPAPRKNSDLATDVAAMTADGGVLLYGIQEDDDQRPTIPSPILLAGAAERIDQIVSTSVSEAPYIEIISHPCAEDASKGYLVVVVPQSARAPHQVTVGGDLRFYGRGATGNRRLTEGEIARLYRRREEWEQDREQLLVECIRNAPYAQSADLGYMHAFARPVAPDRALWDRATGQGREALLESLAQAAKTTGPKDGYSPSLHGSAIWERRGSDAWRLSTQRGADAEDPTNARYLVFCEYNIDGRGYMFCGRAAERVSREGPDPTGRLVIIESIIAGNLASFLAMLSALYESAGYHGHVDIGVAVTGIQNGQSITLGTLAFEPPTYKAATYTRTERIGAAELAEQERVAGLLLRHLVEATVGDGFDPFVGKG